jgi:Flp pilus assembly secretin CpaC
MRFAGSTHYPALRGAKGSVRRRFFTRSLLLPAVIAALCLFSAGESYGQSTKAPKGKPQISAPKDDLKQAAKYVDAADKALAAGKMNEALADYAQAVKAAPGDVGIARRAASGRAQVVQLIVDRAEKAALDGHGDDAVDLMYQALQIDPGDTIIAERLQQMKQMPKDFVPAGDREDFELKGPATLKPQRGQKAVNVRGDSKSAYEQVARMFGITVSFDPELTAHNVKLRLDNADFYTAMNLLGVESQTFYRMVNPTLIFVASDTIAKRKEYSEEIEQTFPLEDSVSPEDLTEMVRVLREITNSTRISQDPKNHSLTIRETADKVTLAKELMKELDQSRRDVMLDIELLEVDRTKARTLGITPPTNIQAFPLNSQDVAQLEAATDLSNLLTLLSQVFTAKGFTGSAQDVLPVGGGKSTFLLTMPNASATFSEGLSLVRSGREILMRAQDGKPATFFVGERFPVTLSLLSTSLGGTTIGGAPTSTVFARTDFAVGQDPVAVTALDFNNDAQLDLAVANKTDNSISILLNSNNNGLNNGNFTPAPGSPIKLGANEQAPSAIAAKVLRAIDTSTQLAQPGDLVIANSGSNTVSVLLGSENFDGTFAEAVGSPFTVGAKPSGVVIADFNGDGFPDFAVINQGDNTISVFQGDGKGGFTPFPKSPFALPAAEKGPIAIVSAIFDNSGSPEIAVLNAATQNIGIFQAVGGPAFNGTFTEISGSPLGAGVDPVAFAAGDLNSDGIADIAVVNQSANLVTVLLNDGTGFFTPAVGSPLPTAATPAGVTIADFTNDGIGSIAVTDNGVGTLAVYVGLGGGQYLPRIELSVPAGPLAVINAVLTSSGLPDAVLTASSGTNNFVTVLLDPTSFAAGGNGLLGGAGSAQTPYPGSEFIDLGVKVKATPAVHENNEVTLQLEFEIRALSGNNVNGIPIITNRTVSQTVRLKENEPSIIAGLLDNEETKALSGIPGLANVPGLGFVFGQKSNSLTDTEFLIVVTPRRMTDHLRRSRARYAGAGGAGPGGTAGPVTPAAPEP